MQATKPYLIAKCAIFYVNKNNVDKEFFVLIDEGYGADNGKNTI